MGLSFLTAGSVTFGIFFILKERALINDRIDRAFILSGLAAE